ncbi:hypothetical protein D3C76_876660 [compost metagenome]
MDVVAEDRGHLPTLYFRHTLVRVQDEDVDVVATAATFDGGRTGITAGGANDHHALAALDQHVVEQAAEQLQGKVLEGQGRAVEQLHDPLVRIQLAQRRHGRVSERAVGFFEDLLEVGIGDAAGNERAHHTEGQFVVRQASPGGDLFLGEAWQVFRDVQAAVAGKASQQHIFKVQGRCLAAGADIAHGANLRDWGRGRWRGPSALFVN